MNDYNVSFLDVVIEMRRAIRILCERIDLVKGEITGLVGRNGSGKSTLLRGMAGLIENVDGTFVCRGHSVKLGSRAIGRKTCSYVDPYFAQWLPETTLARDFLMALWCAQNEFPWYRPYTRANVLNIIAQYGIGFEERFLFQDIGSLSTGQRQLLSLLVILLHRAEIRFVDEVSANLDAYWTRVAFQKLKKTGEDIGFYTIIVSHDLELIAEYAQACYVVKSDSESSGRENGVQVARVTRVEWIGGVPNKITALREALEF